MKKPFFIILSFVVAISCSETLRPDSDNVGICRQQEISAPDYHISLETALESLDGFFDAMDGTKSTSDRIRIADTIRLGRQPGTTVKSIESTDTSTILYVVNFEDDAGYAVLAADSRLPVDIYPLNLIYTSSCNILTFTDSLGDSSPRTDTDPTIFIGDTLKDIWAGE